jgi:mono/diheme cytochrome c family protein
MERRSKLSCVLMVAVSVVAGACASGSSTSTETVTVGAAAGTQAGAAESSMNEAGRAIFSGKGNCYACHGPEGQGTMLAPDLTDAAWLIADGSLESIVKVVTDGVPQPTTSSQPMPARGGGTLTDAEILGVSRYVVSLRQR